MASPPPTPYRSTLKRKRTSQQDHADDMEDAWPPAPAKIRRIIFPESHGNNLPPECQTSQGAMRVAAGQRSWAMRESTDGLLASSDFGMPNQSAEAPNNEIPRLQQIPPNQNWAQLALWQARDPFLEFIDQEAVGPAMQGEGRQFTEPIESENLSDRVGFIRRFDGRLDKGYDITVSRLLGKNDRFRPPGHAYFRAEEMGTNPLDPSRPLYGGVPQNDKVFLLRVTKTKESLSAQQRLTLKERDWSGGDTRRYGMMDCLIAPETLEAVYKNVRTGDIKDDQDFQEFQETANRINTIALRRRLEELANEKSRKVASAPATTKVD